MFSGFYNLHKWLVLLIVLPFLSVAAEDIRVIPGQYIVEFKTAAFETSNYASSELQSLGAQVAKELNSSTKLVTSNTASFSSASLESIPFDPNDDFCINLVKTGVAEHCSPNFEISVNVTPNDPQYSSLWGMSNIDAPQAWDVQKGSNNVIVAVIDTGIDYNHPDLKDNIWTNPFEVAGNGIDDDGNGYVDDVYGMSSVNGSGNPFDDAGHGTHVAGTIGAKGNNGVGLVGVNWNVKMMGLKFLDEDGFGSVAGAIEAIEYMVDMKNRGVDVRISNNSWGGGGYSQSLYNTIKSAEDAGIIFVAAAGNNYLNDNDYNPTYPASYDLDNIVSVAAIDSNNNLASFTNYGLFSVDIAAPGKDILSTYPGNTYTSLSGTSMATPHVAGALALLLASNPALSNQQLIQRLYESGEATATLNGYVYTGRKLNASRMLRNQVVPVPVPEDPANCTFSASDILYSPDYSADNGTIVQQVDEFAFYQVDLPFVFPFADDDVTKVFISPNGVIYTKSSPGYMDNQNGETAPINSIAALHSDLFAQVDPNGVRIYKDSNHLTVYWRVKHYFNRAGGDIHIRTSLYASGEIKNFVEADDPSTLELLQEGSTIGVRAQRVNSDLTYAYNDTKVTNRTAVRFLAKCEEPKVSVHTLDAYTINRKRQRVNKVRPGRALSIEVLGIGSGTVNMDVLIDGKSCGTQVPVSISNGTLSTTTIVPRSFKRHRSLELRIDNTAVSGNSTVNDVLKIKRKRRKNRKKRKKKLKNHSTACSQFVGNLGGTSLSI